jgi:uncharacterized protein YecE (DUF72 family)
VIEAGPGSPCPGRCRNRTLTPRHQAITARIRQGREVYCYFDNDEAGYAAQNALHLQNLLQNR